MNLVPLLVFWAGGAVEAVHNISAVLLKYPTSDGVFFQAFIGKPSTK